MSVGNKLKFLLDDTEVENPVGWEDLRTTIRREGTFNACLVSQDVELGFIGTGYAYLHDLFLTNFCNKVDVKILANIGDEQVFTQIIRGTIFSSDCKFNERTGVATVKIEDRSFYASINNNKSIKTSPFTSKSKNGEDITVCPTYEVDFYKVSNNTLARADVPCVRVYDAFRFMIDFMTDGTVGFESETFDVGGDWEGLCITIGAHIRTGTASKFTQFSFMELYQAVAGRIPIGLRVLNPYDNPTIKIEVLSDLYDVTPVFDFENIYEILTSTDQNRLYSKIHLKTGAVLNDFSYPFPEDIDFFGFKDEEFFIIGDCNIDKSLDIFCDWVCSSNVIQSIVEAPFSQDYDSDLFLINTTLSSTTAGRTTNTDFLQVGAYYYNEALTNSATAIRYMGFVPNSIASFFFEDGAYTFKAYRTTDITHTATVAPDNDDYNPLALNAEDFDINAAYDTGLYRFTAGAIGVYRIKTRLQLDTSGGVGTGEANFQAYIRHYDSTGTLRAVGDVIIGSTGTVIYGYRMFTPNTFLGGVPYRNVVGGSSYTFEGDRLIIMQTGDYIVYRFSKVGAFGDVDYTIQGGSSETYMECTENSLGSGTFQTGDPSTYPALVHEFTYPLRREDFLTILNNNTSLVGFAMSGKSLRSAWVEELIYNEVTGNTTVKLITDKTTQNAS